MKKETKKLKSAYLPAYLMIVVAILVAAILLVGGLYVWYYSTIAGPIAQLAANQQALSEQIKKLDPKATDEAVIEEEAVEEDVEEVEEDIDGKRFEGDGFSFIYPEEYIADDKGIWTKEGYDRHINPPAYCDTCQIPLIGIISESTSTSLEKYILDNFQLPGDTLEEMNDKTNIPYSTVELGDNEFIKITVSDHFDVTGYYTKKGRDIVAFRVYWSSGDNKELREIISTLDFE